MRILGWIITDGKLRTGKKKKEEQAPRKCVFHDTAKESNLEIRKIKGGHSHHAAPGAPFKFSPLLTLKANSTEGPKSGPWGKEHGLNGVGEGSEWWERKK